MRERYDRNQFEVTNIVANNCCVSQIKNFSAFKLVKSLYIATKLREVQRKSSSCLGIDLEVDIGFVRERQDIQQTFKTNYIIL